MIQHSINLPFGKRLDLHLVNRRSDGVENQPIFPQIKTVLRIKKGSKISRYFRHIFEHKNAKRLFGANLAVVLTASAIIPTQGKSLTPQYEETLVAQTKVVLTTEKGIQYPVKLVNITQAYKFYHPALDFDGVTGNPIYPIMEGTVEAVDYSKYAYGNAVYINHGGGVTSLYAHLSKIFVIKDQEIKTDGKIGEMGATGRANGDHLHLEIRQNGIPINPSSVLP